MKDQQKLLLWRFLVGSFNLFRIIYNLAKNSRRVINLLFSSGGYSEPKTNSRTPEIIPLKVSHHQNVLQTTKIRKIDNSLIQNYSGTHRQFYIYQSMYFSKSQSFSNNIQFGSPKTSSTFNNLETSKIASSNYPLEKDDLNLSGDYTAKNLGIYKPRVTSPMPQSYGHKLEGRTHTRHTTEITDSLTASKCVTENTNTGLIELEFQISSLKNENKKLRQEYQRKIFNISEDKNREITQLISKVETANELVAKKNIRIQQITAENKILDSQNKNFITRFSDSRTKIEDTMKKSEEANKHNDSLKQQLKSSKIQLSELQNFVNKLETEITQVNIKLKSSEERLEEIKKKEENYKSLIVTMSQEKTLLNNRISQLMEQQAKLHNAQVVQRSESNQINLQKSNNELMQQVSHLKKKINDILNEQQSSSLKVLYQNKIIMMERQIQQLKHRYQSPDTNQTLHGNNELQWKNIVDEKGREISELKNIITNLQNKITQLNKELLNSESCRKVASSSHLSFEAETQINNLKIQVKNLKKTLQMADQKLKYLINEGKKKDEFLKQYLSTGINKSEEIGFIQNFFKRYQTQIPSQGFTNLSMKQLKTIAQLEDRVNYLSNKVYGR